MITICDSSGIWEQWKFWKLLFRPTIWVGYFIDRWFSFWNGLSIKLEMKARGYLCWKLSFKLILLLGYVWEHCLCLNSFLATLQPIEGRGIFDNSSSIRWAFDFQSRIYIFSRYVFLLRCTTLPVYDPFFSPWSFYFDEVAGFYLTMLESVLTRIIFQIKGRMSESFHVWSLLLGLFRFIRSMETWKENLLSIIGMSKFMEDSCTSQPVACNWAFSEPWDNNYIQILHSKPPRLCRDHPSRFTIMRHLFWLFFSIKFVLVELS